jgi:hypothetical protein
MNTTTLLKEYQKFSQGNKKGGDLQEFIKFFEFDFFQFSADEKYREVAFKVIEMVLSDPKIVNIGNSFFFVEMFKYLDFDLTFKTKLLKVFLDTFEIDVRGHISFSITEYIAENYDREQATEFLLKLKKNKTGSVSLKAVDYGLRVLRQKINS